jgi:energy-coupling factor transporter transmembrane protein EcfT
MDEKVSHSESPTKDKSTKSNFGVWYHMIRETLVQMVVIGGMALLVSVLTKGVNLKQIPTRTYVISSVMILAGIIIGGLVALFFAVHRHGRAFNLKSQVTEAYTIAIEKSFLNPKLKDNNHEQPPAPQ